MILAAIKTHGGLHLVHYKTAFQVDMFIPKLRPLDRHQMEHRTPSTVTTDPERGL